jgi:hypothetical protein
MKRQLITVIYGIAAFSLLGQDLKHNDTHVSRETSQAMHAAHLLRPDAYAPVSVMGDHTHHPGGLMVSYRLMSMNMDGMRHGTDGVSAAEVFAANYGVTPESMTMQMHMFGVMAAPTNDLTLMLMLTYRRQSMEHRIFAGAAPLLAANGGRDTFSASSEGLGDTSVTALYRLHDAGNHHVHAGLGLSLPTGAIDEIDDLPGPGGRIERQLPAPMQLGSGSLDLMPSLTYVYRGNQASFGLQARGVVHTHDNSHDYRLGDRLGVDSWIVCNVNSWCSVSAGLGYRWEDQMRGEQSDLITLLPPAFTRRSVPTAFSENSGGERVDGSIGVTFVRPRGRLAGHRLAVELRIPLYQDLNGYQLEVDSIVTIGWRKAF